MDINPTIIEINGFYFIAYAKVDGLYFDANGNVLNASRSDELLDANKVMPLKEVIKGVDNE